MKEWSFEEAVDVIAKALKASEFALQTDMTEDESVALAKEVAAKLEQVE